MRGGWQKGEQGGEKGKEKMLRERRRCWEKGADGIEKRVDGQKKLLLKLEICYQEESSKQPKLLYIRLFCLDAYNQIVKNVLFSLKEWLPLASDLR